MNQLFLELTIVLITAGAVALLVSFFKQPTLLAYLVTGLLLGPLGFARIDHPEIFNTLSQIGVTLLLFMVGLELDIGQLKRMGRHAILAGIGQVGITAVLAFILLTFLNFSLSSGALIALGLTFSSTIVAIKLLTEKRDLQSLYGKLALGIFLVQDLVAIILLVLIPTLNSGNPKSAIAAVSTIAVMLGKLLLIGLLVYWHSKHIFPRVLRYVGRSDELLLIFSLAWALGFATLLSLPFIGLSLEVGGFLAGLALANSAVHYQITARIKSLRDFFIILFFISLGAQLNLVDWHTQLPLALVLVAFVLLVKPLVVLIHIVAQGFKARTAFFTAATVSQVSEFSLILFAYGEQNGILPVNSTGLLTIVASITIATSSYLTLHSVWLAEKLKPLLKLLEFRGHKQEKTDVSELKRHVILIGAHRLGSKLIKSLVDSKHNFIVVDFNPDVVHQLTSEGVMTILGDITDTHIQESANLSQAYLIISTIPELHDNLSIVELVKNNKFKSKLIVTAQDEHEARILYAAGADYVIIPHFIGALHLQTLLNQEKLAQTLKELRKRHLNWHEGGM